MQHAHPIDAFIETRRATDRRFNKGTFAKLVGVDRSTIHRLMAGDDSVSTELIETIEAKTGISAIALFAAWQAAKKKRAADKAKAEAAADENLPARA